MNEYEAIFILDPDNEDKIKELQGSITRAITGSNGSVTKEDNWGKKKLPFPIKKKKEGIYYKLDFSADPSQISLLNNNYKLNGDILRVMITRK